MFNSAARLAFFLCTMLAIAGCKQSQPNSAASPQNTESTVADPNDPPAKTSNVWVVPAITKVPNIGRFTPAQIVLTPNNCGDRGRCEVAEDFGFVRKADGVKRAIIRGIKTDGTSLPDFAVDYFGGRFNPAILPAAVVHDHYCIRHIESFLATHRLYYEMLLALGIEQKRALIMYAGVLIGGPKWVTLDAPFSCPSEEENCIRMTVPQLDAKYRVKLSNTRSALLRKDGNVIWEAARSTDENANNFNILRRKIANGLMVLSPEQVEQEVIQLKKGDPFFELSKASRSKVSLAAFNRILADN